MQSDQPVRFGRIAVMPDAVAGLEGFGDSPDYPDGSTRIYLRGTGQAFARVPDPIDEVIAALWPDPEPGIVERVLALCAEWDALAKGEHPTTRAIRQALFDRPQPGTVAP